MLKVLLRYFAYATLIAGAAAGLLWMALRWPGGLLLNFVVGEEDTLGTSEFSPVEQLQHLLLLLSAGIFAWVAIRDRCIEGKEVLPEQSLVQTKDYAYDETEVLGKASEEQILREAIADDFVRSVTRQLTRLDDESQD